MEYQSENFKGKLDFRSRVHENWYMKPHLHEYSEIIYIRHGFGNITVNGESITLTEKQFAWIPPNYIHEYHCENAESVCAVFSNDLIPLFFNAANGRKLVVTAIDSGELSSLLEILPDIKSEHYITISGYLNLISAKVVMKSTFIDKNNLDGELLQKTINYISEHYTENISLSKIAKKFGYNEKYLSHSLHSLTGIHFKQLLTFYRVEHAKMLLTSKTSMPLSEVATYSGFSAINSFNRNFKEATGRTPSEYRKRTV